jgi:hypothetical protein
MPIIPCFDDKSTNVAGAGAAAFDAKGASAADTPSSFLQQIASTIEWRQKYHDRLSAEYNDLNKRVKAVKVTYGNKEMTLDKAYSERSANGGYDAWPESDPCKAADELDAVIANSGSGNYQLAMDHSSKRFDCREANFKLSAAKLMHRIVAELEQRIKKGEREALILMNNLVQTGFRLSEDRSPVTSISDAEWEETEKYNVDSCISIFNEIVPECHFVYKNTENDGRFNLTKYYSSLLGTGTGLVIAGVHPTIGQAGNPITGASTSAASVAAVAAMVAADDANAAVTASVSTALAKAAPGQ